MHLCQACIGFVPCWHCIYSRHALRHQACIAFVTGMHCICTRHVLHLYQVGIAFVPGIHFCVTFARAAYRSNHVVSTPYYLSPEICVSTCIWTLLYWRHGAFDGCIWHTAHFVWGQGCVQGLGLRVKTLNPKCCSCACPLHPKRMEQHLQSLVVYVQCDGWLKCNHSRLVQSAHVYIKTLWKQ